jgi:uncharacterized protein YhhL (DUF1145 family)
MKTQKISLIIDGVMLIIFVSLILNLINGKEFGEVHILLGVSLILLILIHLILHFSYIIQLIKSNFSKN